MTIPFKLSRSIFFRWTSVSHQKLYFIHSFDILWEFGIFEKTCMYLCMYTAFPPQMFSSLPRAALVASKKKTILYFPGLTFSSEANADHIWSGLLIKYDQQFWTNIHAVRCTLRCVNEEKWKIMNCSFVQFFYTAP